MVKIMTKKLKNLLSKWNVLAIALVAMMSVGLSSCGGDDSDDPVTGDDLSVVVQGTYSGRLTNGEVIVSDAYIVTITKLTNETVQVQADFFDGSKNFNLSKSGNQISFSNATLSNFSMYYMGGNVVINYLSKGGAMLTYNGKK